LVGAELVVSAHRGEIIHVAGFAIVGLEGLGEEDNHRDRGKSVQTLAVIVSEDLALVDTCLDLAFVQSGSDGDSGDIVDPFLADLKLKLAIALLVDDDGVRWKRDFGIHFLISGLVTDSVNNQRWRG